VLEVVANAFTTATRVRREARSLVSEGFEVQTLCWDRQGRHPNTETMDDCLVHNVRLGRTTALPSSKLYYAIAAVVFQVAILLWVVRQVKKQGLAILTAHDFNTLLGCAAARMLLNHRVRMVYDCHELTPGLYEEWYGPMVSAIVARLELAAGSRADAIISVNEAIADFLQQTKSGRSAVIYNCPAMAEIPMTSAAEAKKRLGLSDYFVVLFSGWVRQDYDFSLILHAANYLKRHNVSDIKFVFVGPPEATTVLKTDVASEGDGLDTLFDFRGWVTNEDLFLYYAASDLCFAVTRDLGRSTRVLTPTKMFESMACGVPVAVRKGTLAAQIVRSWNCGVVVDGKQMFLTELLRLRQTSEPNALGRAGQKAFREVFNWDLMAGKLLDLYNQLYCELLREARA